MSHKTSSLNYVNMASSPPPPAPMAADAPCPSEVSCPVCYQIFITPNLPITLDACSHCCCLVCLQRAVILQSGSRWITCLLAGCNAKTEIPNGVDALEANIHVQNLVKEMGYEKADKGEKVMKSRMKCTQHGKDMVWYCQSCNRVLCDFCDDSDHQGANQVKSLKNVVNEQKIEAETVLNCTRNERLICGQSMKELETLKKCVIDSLELQARELDWTVQARIAEIQQEAQVLNVQLKQIGSAKMDKIQQEISRVQKRATSLKSACQVTQELSNALPDYAYVTQHDAMVQKLKMLSMEGRDLRVDLNPHAAKFQKGSKSPVSHLGKVLKVVTPRTLKLIRELDKFEDAFKVAMSSSGLLAVCNSNFASKEVVIYERKKNLYEKKMMLALQSSNPWCPRDIAITPNGRFIVARKTGIEVYSSTGMYQQTHTTTTSKELSDTETDVASVAVLGDDWILAGDIDRCMITEHEPSGKITRRLRTSIRPMFITPIRDNQVAISDDKKNKVLVIDTASGKEILSMDIPLVQGVCYDEQTESLLIVRNEASQYQQPISRTGFVEQYCCSTGQLVARLAHGLYFPKGIALRNRVFAVADQDEVKVYQVS